MHRGAGRARGLLHGGAKGLCGASGPGLPNQRKLRDLEQKLALARKPQAELTAEVASLRMDLAKVRGQVEETGHVLGSMPNAEALAADLEEKKPEEPG